MSHWFPLEGWLDSEPERLYGYVQVNRSRLLASAEPGRPSGQQLREQPFPQQRLLEALDREHGAGRRILALIGDPPW